MASSTSPNINNGTTPPTSSATATPSPSAVINVVTTVSTVSCTDTSLAGAYCTSDANGVQVAVGTPTTSFSAPTSADSSITALPTTVTQSNASDTNGAKISNIQSAADSSAEAPQQSQPASSGVAAGTADGAAVGGIATGTAAGAAVGCFFVGALIAAVAMFIWMRKRSKSEQRAMRSRYVADNTPSRRSEKDTPFVTVTPIGRLDFLPQQAADSEVQRKLTTVTDQIDQHVENFYENRRVPLDANLESEISRFETTLMDQPLAACFNMAGSPAILLKHCLAFHIFNLTLAPSDGTHPLLPAELAGMVSKMYKPTLISSSCKETISAFSSWKSLTTYLRPDLLRDSNASRSTSRDAARIASHFTRTFAPWASTQYAEEHRSHHLTELINHAVVTATWIFGQPDNFRFDWNIPGADVRQSVRHRTSKGVVVVPAIWKVTHNGALIGGKGQRIADPVVRSY